MSNNRNRNRGQQDQAHEELTEDVLIDAEAQQQQVEPVEIPVTKPAIETSNTTRVTQPTSNSSADPLEVFLSDYQTKLLAAKKQDDMARLQMSIYNKFLEILNEQSTAEAHRKLNLMLNFMFKNKKKGAFNAMTAYRGGGSWTLGRVAYQLYMRLYWIFLTTADPATRQENLRSLDFSLVETKLNQTQHVNLISFYGV